MPDLTPERRAYAEWRFALGLALAAVVLAALPGIFASLSRPAGSSYLGHVYNTDDHMVYAAWMRQAMDGRLLFDNRFTTDAQPGLTIHLYFLVLGWVAQLTGIGLAANLARLGFSFLFVLLLYRIVRRLHWDVYAHKLAMVLPVVGGGLGFLVWHTFGQAIVKPAPAALSGPLMNRLPTDVWQPEMYVFPSMLTNGLFMVSLCLMGLVLLAVLKARDNWKSVGWGAGCMFLLMNIHSYDVLLLTLVLGGFLVACLSMKQVRVQWVLRAAVIGAGAIPPALWFMYVLQNDPVFQARAATETFSPNFRQVLFGLFLPVLLGLSGLALRPAVDVAQRQRRLVGVALVAAVFIGLFVAAGSHVSDGYFLSFPAWAGVTVVLLAAVALLADEDATANMLIAWALIGVAAVYYPGLFQRKLAMGLAIPWCILAAYGLGELLRKQDRSSRNLVAALAIIIFGASSVRWAFREVELAAANASNTSVHQVYVSSNLRKILDRLNSISDRKVVLAMPGVPSPAFRTGRQEEVRRDELAPLLPDLNPIASGLTGAYTHAGHWSETPSYGERRNALTRIFVEEMPAEQRQQQIKATRATYVIAPVPEAFPGVVDLRPFGDVLVDGSQFRLIRLR